MVTSRAVQVASALLVLILHQACASTAESEPPLLVVDVGGGDTLDLADRTASTVIILNQGGGTLSWSATCSGTDSSTGNAWLSCSKIAGEVGGTPDRMDVSVSRVGLRPGEYEGQLAFTSNGGAKTVLVRMSVIDATSTLTASPATLDFGEVSANVEKTLTIAAVGRGVASWSLVPSDEAGWVEVSPAAGQLTAPGQVDVVVKASPAKASRYGAVGGFIRLVGGADLRNIPVTATVVVSCEGDSDCSRPGSYCEKDAGLKMGRCASRKPIGASCTADTQCQRFGGGTETGFCVDGTCCESPCDSTCESCGEDGHCMPLEEGTLDAKCGEASTCNPGTCDRNGDCEFAPQGTACSEVDECSVCDGRGMCSTTLLAPGYCRIDGECVAEGQVKPGAPCLACNVAVSPIGWTPRPEGADCEDDDWCTHPDECDGKGVCLTPARVQADDGSSELDDHVDCTEDHCDPETRMFVHVPVNALCLQRACRVNTRCDPIAGCVDEPRPVEDDGFACTIDTCDPETGEMVHTPDHARCSDTIFCTTNERCDPGDPRHDGSGCVKDETPVSDGIDCTVDRCDIDTDTRIYSPDDAYCQSNDDRYCKVNKRCDSQVGCVADDRNTDDGLDCTEDFCDEVDDFVRHEPNDSRCADNRFCTTNERCEPEGVLPDVRGCVFDVTMVDDGVPCTKNLCDLASDKALFSPDNSRCQDDLFCTVNERCDVNDGCVMDLRFADDGIGCTLDLCNEEENRIDHLPDDEACGDVLACTLNERCLPLLGCVWDSPVLDDGIGCTVDGCEEPVGVYHRPEANRCEPKECADVACDPLQGPSGCVYTPKPFRCLINGVCRADGDLNPANSCQYCAPLISQVAWSVVESGVACDDRQTCTYNDVCSSGVCQGTPHERNCDDGLVCTSDVCNHDGTCTHGIIDDWCVIQGWGCVAEGTLDESACLTCDPLRSSVSWSSTREGLTCDDRDACTATDRCIAGSCSGNPISCDDGLGCTIDQCDSASGCVYAIRDGYCLVGSYCALDGSLNPNNECQGCLASSNPKEWSPVRGGASCVDDVACTHTDVCVSGVCQGELYACEDNVACTNNVCLGDGGCDYPVQAGKCLIGGACYVEGQSDPGNSCRECRSASDQRAWTNDDSNSCSDGNFCTWRDRCDSGNCVGTTYSCDDNLHCTMDSCDGIGGCVNEVMPGFCLIDGICYDDEDTNPLNECEICHTQTSVAGWTAYDAAHSPTKHCDDGNEATSLEYCAFGACVGSRMPATASNYCAHDTDIFDSCPTESNYWYGQDAHYNVNLPILLVDANGVASDYTTGLTWWYSSTDSTYAGASSICHDLVVSGRSDWRLPSMIELATVIALWRGSTAWDGKGWNPKYNFNGLDIDAWTSTPSSIASGEYWAIFTTYSDGACADTVGWRCIWGARRTASVSMSNTICVSGGTFSKPAFAQTGPAAVTDFVHNLQWTATDASGTWGELLNYCEDLVLDGQDDWRLPSIKELWTLVDYSRTGPATYIPEFADTSSGWYFSASQCPGGDYTASFRSACAIDFDTGTMGQRLKSRIHKGRCVRSVAVPPLP